MRRLSIASALVLATIAARAEADPSVEDRAAAQTLFEDAKKLAAAGRYDEACPKLEESQRLMPGAGTQFKLADCYEHTGRTASAWILFKDVLVASKGNAEREKVAQERVSAIEPKLTRLKIVVAGPDTSGLVVKRDANAINQPLWGTAVPVDPGPHVITASAPDRETFSITTEVRGEGKTIEVDVPVLEKTRATTAPIVAPAATPSASAPSTSAPPPTAAPARDAPSDGSTQRTIALVVGGAGVIGLGVGAVAGVVAIANKGKIGDNCAGNLCNANGIGAYGSARSAGNIATIALAAGGALTIGGVVLYLTAPKASTTAAIEPSIGPGLARVDVGGSF